MEYLNEHQFLIFLNLLTIILLIKVNRKDALFGPKVVLPIIIFLYIILGNINLEFFQDVIGWYNDVKPNRGNLWAFVSLLIMNCSLLLLRRKSNSLKSFEIKQNSTYFFNWIWYDRLVIGLSIIAFILNALNYKAIGGLMIFKGNLTGMERFEVGEKMISEKGLVLSSFLLCPIIVRLFLQRNERWKYFVLLAINFLFAFGLGHRQLIFMPLITAGVFLYSMKAIKGFIIWIFVAALPILILISSFLRGDSENVNFADESAYFGNEYRDFLRLQDDKIAFQNGATIHSVFFNSIPKQVYQVLGYEKDDFRIYSAYILMDFWGNETGQRAGIWGEFYLNWGYIGLLICFFTFSLIIHKVDINVFERNHNYRTKFLYSYLYSLLIFSVIASWGTIGDDLGSVGILYILFFYKGFSKASFYKPLP